MKAEFVLLGLMFTVGIFLNLKREALMNMENNWCIQSNVENVDTCVVTALWIVLWNRGNTNIHFLHGNNTGYSIYKKGGKKMQLVSL